MSDAVDRSPETVDIFGDKLQNTHKLVSIKNSQIDNTILYKALIIQQKM